jgi:hypothetical protein
MTHYVPYILVHMPHELKLGYVNLTPKGPRVVPRSPVYEKLL